MSSSAPSPTAASSGARRPSAEHGRAEDGVQQGIDVAADAVPSTSTDRRLSGTPVSLEPRPTDLGGGDDPVPPVPALPTQAVVPTPSPPAQGLHPQRVGFRGIGYWWRRTTRWFGFGRGNEARKELAKFIFGIFWATAQIAALIALLTLAGVRPRFTNEWSSESCNRPIGAWCVVWMARVAAGYWPAIVQYRHKSRIAAAAAAANQPAAGAAPGDPAPVDPAADLFAMDGAGAQAANVPPAGPTVQRANRLSSLLTFLSIVHWVVAQALLFTTLDTCYSTAPHLWWALFSVVCIGYVVILEVIIIGATLFIIVPLVVFFVNLILVALGRPPIRIGPQTKHEVPKISQKVVDRIPLVLYIPPPPSDFPDPAPPATAHFYPPLRRASTVDSSKPQKGKFRFLNKKRLQVTRKLSGKGGSPQGAAWEDTWEKGDWPFVRLEENRATCGICLMDFEPPKKISPAGEPAPSTVAISSANSAALITVEDALADPDGLLRLEDAGEGVQPLRLLRCGHVFHKTCIDPWLLNSSGRCPHCQKPILVEHENLTRNSNH